MPSTLEFLALAIVVSAGLFLFFLVRLVLDMIAIAVYARFLREIRVWELRQREFEAGRRYPLGKG